VDKSGGTLLLLERAAAHALPGQFCSSVESPHWSCPSHRNLMETHLLFLHFISLSKQIGSSGAKEYIQTFRIHAATSNFFFNFKYF
jgi:hypothetical protein